VAPQAFLYDGRMIDIDPNSELQYSPASAGYGINDEGQVVGDVLDAGGDSHVFLYSNGGLSRVPVDGFEPQARDINRRGDIVGSTWFEATPPFLLSAGVQTSLGSEAGQAEAIDDRGFIVGWNRNAFTHDARAFLATRDAITELGTLGGAESRAAALNKSTDVVGSADTIQGEQHAFLYRDGTMLDLNDLVQAGSGFVLEEATGINDSGEIVGTGTIGGATHAFLLAPAH
jgi:probable HAF family extracellular repeat protein